MSAGKLMKRSLWLQNGVQLPPFISFMILNSTNRCHNPEFLSRDRNSGHVTETRGNSFTQMFENTPKKQNTIGEGTLAA